MDLTDYHIINRIRTGIYDDVLQQEVLQKHDTLKTVDGILQYCENFECTKHGRDVLQTQNEQSVVNSLNIESHDLAEEEIVAALSAYRREKQYSSSSASDKNCLSCGYPAHANTGKYSGGMRPPPPQGGGGGGEKRAFSKNREETSFFRENGSYSVYLKILGKQSKNQFS